MPSKHHGTVLAITRDAGVAEIRQLMLSGQWVGYEKWAESRGLIPGTVAGWAAEASRQIRQAIPDEVYLDELRGWLERLGTKAEASGDWKSAIKAIEVMLGVRDRDLKRYEVAKQQVLRATLAEKVARLLDDPEYGPALVNEVLRRRGLLVG